MRPEIVWLLVGWLLGLTLGQYEARLVVIAIVVLGMGGFVLVRGHRFQVGVATSCVLVLGAVTGYSATPSSVLLACPEAPATTVRVVAPPDVRENYTRYLVASETCRVMVYAARFPIYEVGDVLRLHGGTYMSLTDIEELGFVHYLQRQAVGGTWRYPEIRIEEHQSHVPNWNRMASLALGRIFPEPDGGIIRAMFLDDRSALSNELQEDFRATGISHVIAISGMHVTLLIGLLVVGLDVLPLRPAVRALLLAGIVWAYIMLAGAPLSAVRAGLFWSVALVFFRLGWLVSLPTAMLLAATFIMTIAPPSIHDVGFQLSVSAVAGIFLLLFLLRPWQVQLAARDGPAFLGFIMSGSAVTIGATLMTWPLIAYHFGNISLITVVANLLVVPVIPLVMILSLTAALVWTVLPPLALLLAYPVHLFLGWTLFVADSLSRLPGAYLEGIVLSPTMVVLYYVLVSASAFVCMIWQGRSWREVWE